MKSALDQIVSGDLDRSIDLRQSQSKFYQNVVLVNQKEFEMIQAERNETFSSLVDESQSNDGKRFSFLN